MQPEPRNKEEVMDISGRRALILLAVFISTLFVFRTPLAHGIGCPNGGAALNVVVYNPTSSSTTAALRSSGP
jgi:hypothetical protein